MEHLADAGFRGFKISVVSDAPERAPRNSTTSRRWPIASARRMITRLRPSARGVDVWDDLHPTAAQARDYYDWLLEQAGREGADR